MDKLTAELVAVAKAHNSTLWDVGQSVWELICSKKNSEDYFLCFLSKVDISSIEVVNPKVFFENNGAAILLDINQLAMRIVSNMVQRKVKESFFYHCLWEKICDDTLLPDKVAQISFLICLWIDVRIPYYEIGEGCTMENDEFLEIRSCILPALKKARFILAAPISQKTQRASLIMELADSLEDERHKAVFWANVFVDIAVSTHGESIIQGGDSSDD